MNGGAGSLGNARIETSVPPARWEETDDVSVSAALTFILVSPAGGQVPPVKLSVGLLR